MDAYTEPQSELAGDFLFGADKIADFLTSVGNPAVRTVRWRHAFETEGLAGSLRFDAIRYLE
jgi:hypothetical protein